MGTPARRTPWDVSVTGTPVAQSASRRAYRFGRLNVEDGFDECLETRAQREREREREIAETCCSWLLSTRLSKSETVERANRSLERAHEILFLQKRATRMITERWRAPRSPRPARPRRPSGATRPLSWGAPRFFKKFPSAFLPRSPAKSEKALSQVFSPSQSSREKPERKLVREERKLVRARERSANRNKLSSLAPASEYRERERERKRERERARARAKRQKK